MEYRWNRFVLHGDAPGEVQDTKPKHAKKGSPEYSLTESIHAPEKRILGERHSAHEFEVCLRTLTVNSDTQSVYHR